MKSIAALLSGGVDSAVALAKYIEDFPEDKPYITAYYLKIWLEDELAFLGNCPWEEDLSFAKQVAEQLAVPLQIVSLQREYYERVVSYTIEELKLGGTPSPDIFCNQRIKFGAFLEKVDHVDAIISGHYARLTHSDKEGTHLYCATDLVKDQTYFLCHLSQTQLAQLHFPIGELEKSKVRAYAEKTMLAPYNRKDSQGICFLGKIKYNDFVKYHLGTKQGLIVDKRSGKTLGTHNGTWFHTIGQRSGLGLGGGPWYVAQKNFDENIIFVSHGNCLQDEEKYVVHVEGIHWIQPPKERDHAIPKDLLLHNSDKFPSNTQNEQSIVDLQVKLRHGKDIIPATLCYIPSTQSGIVTLSRGDTGIANGQFTVFYQNRECLGCARIKGVSY